MAEKTTAKKTTTKKTTNSDTKRVKDLEAQVAQLTEMVNLLTKAGLTNVPTTNSNIDRDITFVSLCNHILNLSTEPYGGGVVYTFTEFGEEQAIPYSEARLIIRNNKRFIKEGKCYIMDSDIINAEHLNRDYERLLNSEELLELLNKDRNIFNGVYDNMTKTQKELFKDIVMDKVAKDRNSVDMNIVQKINDTLNTDILQDVEFGKKILQNEN